MTYLEPQQDAPAGGERELPQRADRTTPENPWPLRMLSENLHAYIARCAPTWVEGQIIELNRRARVTYVTLRDVDAEISVPVTLFSRGRSRWAVSLAKRVTGTEISASTSRRVT